MGEYVPKSVGAITLFVEDPQRSRSFYQEVFDLPAIYEDEDAAAFRFENTIVNLLRMPAARDLIEPGAVASRDAGSRFQLTIWVGRANERTRLDPGGAATWTCVPGQSSQGRLTQQWR